MKRSAGKKTQGSAPGEGGTAAAGSSTARRSSTRRWISAAAMVAVVFVLAGLVGTVVRDHKSKQLAPPASAGGPSALAVPVYGHAPVTLTLYEDMRDPATLAFSQTYDETLAKLIASGTVNVLYRETAGVDAAKGGTGSLNAGNALGCAQDLKLFTPYRAVLLQNQPDESNDAFADKATLVTLAKQVKKLDTDVFRACLDKGQHNVWVKDSTSDFKTANLGTSPVLTMQLLGDAEPHTVYDATTKPSPKQLVSMVMAAAQTAPTASPTATPTPSPTPSPTNS